MSALAGSDASNGYREELKTQFCLPEGVYRQVSLAETLRPNRNQQVAQPTQAASATIAVTPGAPVQLSFCTYKPVCDGAQESAALRIGETAHASPPDEMELVSFNYGRELYTYSVPCRNSQRVSFKNDVILCAIFIIRIFNRYSKI